MLKVNLSIFKAGQYKNVYDNREMKIDNKNKWLLIIDLCIW